MDVLQLLFLAYSGDKDTRTNAAAQLDEAFRSNVGLQHLVTLLRAGTDPTLPANQSLLALIYAKNFIMNTLTYEQAAAAPAIFEEVKLLLYNAAFCVPETHQKIIHSSVSTIISMFEWNYLSQLMPEITRERAGVPAGQALASLKLLYVFVKRFKMSSLDPMPMKLTVSHCLITALPPFLSYGNFEIDHFVLKAMECVVETALEVRDARKFRPEALDPWFNEMVHYPERRFVAPGQAATNDSLKTYEAYIRCLKRIAIISFSVLNNATRRKKILPLARRFLKTFAKSFFGVWQRWLEYAVNFLGQCAHHKTDMFAIRYVKLCALNRLLYNECLLPQLQHLLESVLFPFLCLNKEDEVAFDNSASLAEFAQYMMEEGSEESEISRRQVASNAILALVKAERGFHVKYMQKIIDFLTCGLSQKDSNETVSRTFGFLHLLSILRKHLRLVSWVWRTQMSQVLGVFVIPRVLSDVPFVPLRCKALVVCQRYAKVPIPSEEHFASFIQLMCSLVRDADARVKLGAIDAICTLVEIKRAVPYIRPFLNTLVEECMCFLDQIHTNFVPYALQCLIKHFASELMPLLGKIGKKVVQNFLLTAFALAQQENNKNNNDNNNNTTGRDNERFSIVDMSAYTLLDVLDTIVSTSNHNAEVLCSLRCDVVFLARKVLESLESYDYIEQTLSILLNVLNLSKPIPCECWELLPLLFGCVESGVGLDFFSLIEEVLDSFVSNGTVQYLQNINYMEATYSACAKLLFNSVSDTKNRVAAPQLIEAMLHQAKHCSTVHGLFDAYLPRFVSLLLYAFANETGANNNTNNNNTNTNNTDNNNDNNKDVRLQVWIIAALMDAFYYNPAATLQIIDSNNANPQFFDALFLFFSGVITMHKKGKRRKRRIKKKSKKYNITYEIVESLSILTRKVIVLGLTALLEYLTANSAANINNNAALLSCGAGGVNNINNNNNTLESFDKYLEPTLALIEYCVFSNDIILASRCRVAQRNLLKLQRGIDDDDDFDDDLLGINDSDDSDDAEKDYDCYSGNNFSDNDSDDDFFTCCTDEGDEYQSPIDDVCEVTLFCWWVARAAGLGGGVQSHIHCGLLRSAQEFCEAEATALRYRHLVRELDAALAEKKAARQAGS